MSHAFIHIVMHFIYTQLEIRYRKMNIVELGTDQEHMWWEWDSLQQNKRVFSSFV